MLIAILQIPSFILPTFWGNDIFDAKFVHLDHSEEVFDTFFIGSSRINNQINPIFFDKLVGKNATNSFNLGCPGSGGLEIQMAIKEIINSPKQNPKLIFAEISHFATPHGRNSNTIRGRYYYYLQSWLCSSKFELNRPNFNNKLKNITKGFVNYIKNILHFNLFKYEVLRLKNGPNKSRIKNQAKKMGFHPLLEGTNKEEELKRREKLLSDTSILKTRYQGALKVFNSKPKKLRENTFLTEELNNLIEYGEKRGVRIVYLLLPKSAEYNYEVAYPSFLKIPAKNKINLADPKKYGDFYKLEYSFDRAHLNKKGANLLTKAIIDEYKEIM